MAQLAHIGYGIRELRIAESEPATRGDPVGLVLELLRSQLIEIPETMREREKNGHQAREREELREGGKVENKCI